MKGYESFTKEKMVYLYKATKPITYKKLQDRIYFELSNHIDDMFCDYIDNGMNEENATKKFLDEMGDPEELGEELKKTHSKTLLLAKLLKRAIVLAVFALVISTFGFFESKDNIKAAKAYELTEETVKLEKSLITYTDLEYWDIFNDIIWYTNIDWYDLETDKPLYKVKDYNLFNDYYILDETQSVVVDLSYATVGAGKIYIDDISKLPSNYHSDKLSKAVIYQYNANDDTYIEICPDLSPSEVKELEILAYSYDVDEYIVTEELTEDWYIKFYIKDLEGLYYCNYNTSLYKSADGKYYVGYWDESIYAEVPESIAKKIDKAVE